jgi:hypothetical protein
MVSFHRLNICAFTAGKREDPASPDPKTKYLTRTGKCRSMQ